MRKRSWILAVLLLGGLIVAGGVIWSLNGEDARQVARVETFSLREIWEIQDLLSKKKERTPYENMCRACWLPNGSIFCGRGCDATGKTIYTSPGETLDKCGVCTDEGRWKK